MDIKFHCDEKSNFKREEQLVRAFTYKEYFIEPHNHDFYEVNIVLGGSGCHRIGEEAFYVKRGDVFVIPPMVVHAYSDTCHLEVYHILLKKDFIRNNEAEAMLVPGFLQLTEIEPFLRQNSSNAMFLHLTAGQIMEIQYDLKFIEEKTQFDKKEFSALRNHTALKIIYYLSYLLQQQIETERDCSVEKFRHQILDTLEYINYNYSEKITIESLAKRCFLSRSAFLRKFYAVCGCSPIEYLNRYRVKKATELLESSEMSKTEIAHACGFYDLSHMLKAISKITV